MAAADAEGKVNVVRKRMGKHGRELGREKVEEGAAGGTGG